MAYIFAADSIHSFFVVRSERRIFSGTECVSAVQGHPRSLIYYQSKGRSCDFILVISAWKVNYSKNINTINILNAIHDRSSLQQAQITELMEMVFSVHCVNERPTTVV